MKVTGDKGLTQTVNNCFIHYEEANKTPRYVVGAIFRQTTVGRDNPPACLSGFPTGYTPFALGHVMALELGGADVQANIVPQYGQWQGNARGEWRKMEVAMYNSTAEVMIVEVIYSGGPFAETCDAQFSRFASGDQLFHWTEARIPVQFKVWGVKADWKAGDVGAAAYFAADDAGKEAMIGKLVAALPDTGKVFDATISAMPQIDREYWQGNLIRDYAKRSWRTENSVADKKYRLEKSIYDKKLAEWAEKNKGRRAPSARRAVKDTSSPVAPKEPITLEYATWLKKPGQLTKLHGALTDAEKGPKILQGWQPTEIALLTEQKISDLVFAL